MVEKGVPDADRVIAEVGYKLPFNVTAGQSSHHEAAQSIVNRAMMQAILQAAKAA